MPEVAAEFPTEELEDFLRADQLPEQADPGFRERLRDELWQKVQELYASRRRDRSDSR